MLRTFRASAAGSNCLTAAMRPALCSGLLSSLTLPSASTPVAGTSVVDDGSAMTNLLW